MRRVFTPILIVISLLLILPDSARAQSGQATLVNRALVDAKQTWSGPQAGAAFAGKTINGISFPRGYQPVGSFSALFPSQGSSSWLALSTGSFGNPQNSKDYLLTIQILDLNWGNGNGDIYDPIILSDPKGKIKSTNIVNASTPTRYLTGADFNPQAFVQASDGTFWVAEAYGPSLLHFRDNGQLLDTPIPLSGAGALQGMGLVPGGKQLLIAQREQGSNVVLRGFDTTKKQLTDASVTYQLSDPSHNVSDLAMINTNQAVVIEQDSQQGAAAKFKMIFMVDLSKNPAGKTPLVDLLNIADPNGIATSKVFSGQPANGFGLSGPFKFPYVDVAAVYPLNENTLLIVNDNHLPNGTGRSANQADDSDFIAVQIP